MTNDYLTDVLNQLIDDASRLKQDAKSDLEIGILTGYYQVISKLLNQAEAFGLADDLPDHLSGYNPEDLLNGLHKTEEAGGDACGTKRE